MAEGLSICFWFKEKWRIKGGGRPGEFGSTGTVTLGPEVIGILSYMGEKHKGKNRLGTWRRQERGRGGENIANAKERNQSRKTLIPSNCRKTTTNMRKQGPENKRIQGEPMNRCPDKETTMGSRKSYVTSTSQIIRSQRCLTRGILAWPELGIHKEETMAATSGSGRQNLESGGA